MHIARWYYKRYNNIYIITTTTRNRNSIRVTRSIDRRRIERLRIFLTARVRSGGLGGEEEEKTGTFVGKIGSDGVKTLGTVGKQTRVFLDFRGGGTVLKIFLLYLPRIRW